VTSSQAKCSLATQGRTSHEAGILQTEVFMTSVCRVNVPGWDSKKYFSKYTKSNQHPKIEVMDGMKLLKEEICEVQPPHHCPWRAIPMGIDW